MTRETVYVFHIGNFRAILIWTFWQAGGRGRGGILNLLRPPREGGVSLNLLCSPGPGGGGGVSKPSPGSLYLVMYCSVRRYCSSGLL